MKALFVLIGCAIVPVAASCAARWRDALQFRRAWRALAAGSGAAVTSGMVYGPALVSDLPEPAIRYFGFVFADGAPLHTAMRLEMVGTLAMEGRAPMPMQAEQVLAPPAGLAWRVETRMAGLPLCGSDVIAGAVSWSRFWLAQMLPVARAGASEDHWRAAFGRVVAEAAFWAPASLLPQNGAVWERTGPDSARATLAARGFEQSVDISVDAAGMPVAVSIDRWTDANPDKVFRRQPFGGTPGAYRAIDGVRYPMHVEGGNFFGTPGYVPFFIADISRIEPAGGPE